MVSHGARQHAAFDVAALADEIVGCVAMRDALDVLLDDRSLIEIRRNLVGRRPDQLHPALVRLMVGLGPLEAG
jgi:hypothetical protein